MSIIGNNTGFTLIELIVVITLVSIMLFFTMPKFHYAVLGNEATDVSLWIVGKSKALKESAVYNQKNYALEVGINDNRLWISDESMSDEDIDLAIDQGFQLSSGARIIDVEYPDKRGKVSSGTIKISFYKKGYSDKALIHLAKSDDKVLSFLFEPFLSKIKIFDEYIEFDS